tara:strand:- start:1153 stop:1911 length:759 start_codon:yes stop_codon:yes gene_type:complete
MKITRHQLRKLISEISSFSPRAARQSSKKRMMRDASPNLSRTGRGKIRPNLRTMPPEDLKKLQTFISSGDEETHVLGRHLEDTLGDYSSPRSHLGYSSKEDIEEFAGNPANPADLEDVIDEIIRAGYEVVDYSGGHVSFKAPIDFLEEPDYFEDVDAAFTVEIDSDGLGFGDGTSPRDFYISGGPVVGGDVAEAMRGEGYFVELDGNYPFHDTMNATAADEILSIVGDYLDQFTAANIEQAIYDYFGPNYTP